MKKILLLLSMFVLFACEQEDLNGLVGDSKAEVGQQAAVGSRAAGTIADFDPIAELEGIPVNILNVGNTKNKYLSCVKSGSKVDLYSKDDGSLRQRWYIKHGAIYLVGGNDLNSKGNVCISEPGAENAEPLLLLETEVAPGIFFPFGFGWTRIGASYYNIGKFIILNDLYQFSHEQVSAKVFDARARGLGKILYLQSESTTGSSLKFKTSNPGGLAQWEIKPVGNYEIVDIAYAPYTGGKLDSIPQKVSITTVDNSTSSIPVERSFTETVQVTETSRFSKTEGVSFTTKISTTRPLAGPGEPKENGGSVTIENSMTNSWSYTQETTQTKTSTRTDNFKVTVPPYVKYTVTTYINQYRMNIKYVATLRATNGKEFKVKGTWTGTQCYEMYQVVKEERTGRTFIVQGENANKY